EYSDGCMLPVGIASTVYISIPILIGRCKAHSRVAMLPEGLMIAATSYPVFIIHNGYSHGYRCIRHYHLFIFQFYKPGQTFMRRIVTAKGKQPYLCAVYLVQSGTTGWRRRLPANNTTYYIIVQHS